MLRKIFSRTLSPGSSLVRCVNVNTVDINRQIHCGVCLRIPRYTSKPNTTSPALATKYQVITDENPVVIENTAEEIPTEERYTLLSDEFDGINLERGANGVFEIEDLIELLQRENCKDIFVAAVPKDIRYVDYICTVSGRNKRHILGIAEFVRKVYKKKCFKSDHIPRIEGKESDEWMALDLGNIALHVFTEKARKAYDLETLWSVGPEYDDKMNKNSEVVDIFENYSDYLKDLKPLGS